jgi:hypothetical protein
MGSWDRGRFPASGQRGAIYPLGLLQTMRPCVPAAAILSLYAHVFLGGQIIML